ncbi:MAG: type I toxin-antitoxin system SymE family toxin [Chryseobacterium sp.]|uniref:SymE family type I addiction module toxin n=1 Tax=Chryseobacterium sp. TaxID=1871047 RepID=UPI0028373248|nr:SymE family type I addiction module toxin [Chryseobacterium sp.]MDR2237340.1 type I toxin-antitoxin system SymE family toxin [Chryseobacterium sp.]
MIHSRKLKIQTRYQTSTYSRITVPEIRLKGKWLYKLGFKEGQIVTVEQKKNKLTITIDKDQNNNLSCRS